MVMVAMVMVHLWPNVAFKQLRQVAKEWSKDITT